MGCLGDQRRTKTEMKHQELGEQRRGGKDETLIRLHMGSQLGEGLNVYTSGTFPTCPLV